MKWWTVLLVLAPLLAWADVAPNYSPGGRDWGNGCYSYEMFNQGTDGPGLRSSDEIVAGGAARSRMTFDATRSTGNTWTCNVYANQLGFDATATGGPNVTPTGGAAMTGVVKVTTSAITETAQLISLNGGFFKRFFVSCDVTVDAEEVVVVDAIVCPSSR